MASPDLELYVRQLGRDVRKLIRRTLWLYGAIVLLVAAVVAVYFVQRNRDIGARHTTRRDLCVVVIFTRQDKLDQLADSKDYLRHHPGGAPGIPRTLIVSGIRRLERQVAALDAMGCP